LKNTMIVVESKYSLSLPSVLAEKFNYVLYPATPDNFLGTCTFLVATVKLWTKSEEICNMYFVKAVFTSLLEEFNQNFLNIDIYIW